MQIEVKNIKSLLGDRILVRPLSRPDKRGSLMLPASSLKEKAKQSDIWFGTVEALGRDAKYPDAYDIKVGDIVGCEFMGRQCETIRTDDGEEHCWVAEEFIVAKDGGRVARFHSGNAEDSNAIFPVGQYVLVRPSPEEEKRGGVFIPQNAREPQKTGEVLAASEGALDGRELAPLHVEVGQTILYGRYSGSWVRLDEELLLMKQEDIVAVMEPAKEVAHV